MSDRELLELAGKAAEYELWWDYANGEDVAHRTSGAAWNPLTDDGDALRLAAKLEIRASVSGMKAIADWWQRPAMTELNCEVVTIDGDPCAALRRAIVCAAAEIGAPK